MADNPEGTSGGDAASIRKAVEWMIGGSAAVAAAAFAGLQLSQLPSIVASALVAGLGFVLVLAGVGLVLFPAARLLAAPSPSLKELIEVLRSGTEPDGEGRYLWRAAKWVGAQTPELTGRRVDTLPALWAEIREIETRLRLARGQGNTAALQDVGEAYARIANSPSELTKARGELVTVEQSVIGTAFTRILAERFAGLQGRLRLASVISAVGAVLFAGAIAFAASEPLEVVEPTDVVVEFSTPGIAGLPAECESVTGRAIGGTWERPIVITDPVDPCPSVHLTLTPEIGQATPTTTSTTPATTIPAPTSTAIVSEPTPVKVYIEEDSSPPGCGGVRDGVAVGGTWDRPLVILFQVGACDAALLQVDGEKSVAVPAISSDG